ncbi:MAG: type II secretion system protein [Cyanobacteria bacterium SID2]|nr:type II secretion system protein [Cyanobacteria bacterium SID2]MBP0005876.1 type II secretion system protein [Cyanobacteria bacterium SBC]
MFRLHRTASSGFTLVEGLVVITILGILTAIAAPSWLAFVNQQRLAEANEKIYLTMRDAQTRAIANKNIWQASFREIDGRIQAAVHPANENPSFWDSLSPSVRFDTVNTSLRESGGLHYIRFNDRGRIHGQLGRVTLVTQHGGEAKRCTIASTLLGVVRKARDRQCNRN